MRVLLVGRGPDHASSRVRLLQYVEPLQALGHEVRVLRWEPSSRLDVARLSAAALRASRWADVVMIGKPRLHAAVMAAIHRVNPHIVVDIDDAMWTWGDVFAQRYDEGARRARVITAGNGHLAEVAARRYPSARSFLIPAAVTIDEYPVRDPQRSSEPPVVGWIGGPASLDDFSEPVVRALRHTVDAGAIRLRIVSSEPLVRPGLVAEFEPWSLTTEVASVQRFDVGIMPLVDSEASRGRCGLKAIQCMAVGVPVVATPLGAATEIIGHGSSGFLAGTEAEWLERISELAGSPELRLAMGTRARERVEAEFTVSVNAPKLVAALNAAG